MSVELTLAAARERDELAQRLPCDGYCNVVDGPDESCSRHGCDEARAERDTLRAILDGRCLADITHRDEEHRQSVCILAAGHATAHDDGMGCTWTDSEHHGPTEVDGLRATVARVEALHVVQHARTGVDYCDHCCRDWPCETVEALRGEGQ